MDFWSLDTEGSELAILNATRFGDPDEDGAIEVGVLAVEHALYAASGEGRKRRQAARAAIAALLLQRGFTRVSCHDTDDFFANTRYFARRGLPLPNASMTPRFSAKLAVSNEVKTGRWRHGRCPQKS